jgi:uncharacterized membrane protein YdcZ (DUF606 family)
MSSKTAKISKAAPTILGFGSILITAYYFIIGTLLPTSGQLSELQAEFNFIRTIGILLILFANVLFVHQIFSQVVLERLEE